MFLSILNALISIISVIPNNYNRLSIFPSLADRYVQMLQTNIRVTARENALLENVNL